MSDLVSKLPEPLKHFALVREQLAFAQNRLGKFDDARDTLECLISDQGASSETYGLLGRVYKDQWIAARTSGKGALAEGMLDLAIQAYRRGFDTELQQSWLLGSCNYA